MGEILDIARQMPVKYGRGRNDEWFLVYQEMYSKGYSTGEVYGFLKEQGEPLPDLRKFRLSMQQRRHQQKKKNETKN